MRQLKLFWLSLLAVLAFTACSGSDDDETGGTTQKTSVKNVNANDASSQPELARLEFPKVKGGSSFVIIHECTLNSSTKEYGVNYSTEWDPTIKSQRWSCYQMYASLRETHTSRYYTKTTLYPYVAEQYPNDEFVSSEYHFVKDPYFRSGYDHGHICPSADRLSSYACNYQTFFLTNMQPQVNGFNAGLWADMESQIRTWVSANKTDTFYVCKGGTIDSADQIMAYIGSGDDRIPVPKYFYTAVLWKTSTGYRALGFWAQNKTYEDSASITDFIVNIDTLEEYTGIDFFCNLPDDIEDKVEGLSLETVKKVWGIK